MTGQLSAIADALGSVGWIEVPHFLDEASAKALSDESAAAWDSGEFRRAGIGRDDDLRIREDIRSDHVSWLPDGGRTAAQERYFDSIESLRLAINARHFLGLFDFEGHFAIYPEGASYKPHLDCHHNSSDRVISVIVYLNQAWETGDGGELKIRVTKNDQEGEFALIEPKLGTLVAFLSADHWHEVLPSLKPRRSITGWLRVRPLR